MSNTDDNIVQRAANAMATIQEERNRLLASVGVTPKKLFKELALIGFSDQRDYIEIAEGGEIQAIAFDRIVKAKTKAIKKIKEHTRITESKDGEMIFKDSTVEYELYDKVGTLQYLCKLAGLEPAQKAELTGKDGIPLDITVTFVRPNNGNK